MPLNYLHDRKDFVDLLRIIEAETNILAGLVVDQVSLKFRIIVS